MKLYLSSYRIPNPKDLYLLIGKRPEEITVAIIPNAKDYYIERARNIRIKDYTDYFHDVGLKSEIIDLRDFSDAGVLTEVLTRFDLVWALGGNTFCLRYEMRRSGFEKAILGLLQNGLVYGGDSAGAIVAGNSLQGVESADEPAFAEDVIWEGLNLVPHFILPHVGSQDFQEAIEIARHVHRTDKTKIELNNSQAAVFNDDQFTIVG